LVANNFASVEWQIEHAARSAQFEDAECSGNAEPPPTGFAAAFSFVDQDYLDAPC